MRAWVVLSLLSAGCASEPRNTGCSADTHRLYVSFGDGRVGAFGTPIALTAPPDTEFGNVTHLAGAGCLTADDAKDEVYVAAPGAIHVFPRSASGNIQPRSILIENLGAVEGCSLELDDDDIYFVGGQGSIVVVSRSASGPTEPLRTIDPNGYFKYSSLALDRKRGELYTIGYNGVYVVDRDAAGPVAPKRLIRNDETPVRLVFDSLNDRLVVLTQTEILQGFAPTAVGYDPPIASAPLPEIDGGIGAHSLAVDPLHAELVISGRSPFASVLVLPLDFVDPVAPIRSFTENSPASDVSFASSPAHDELFTVGPLGVRTWPRQGSGLTGPVRELSGRDLALGGPLAVDAVSHELFAANGRTVMVFSTDAPSGAAPSRTLTVSGIAEIHALAVDPHDRLLWIASDNTVVEVSEDATGDEAPPLGVLVSTAAGLIYDDLNDEIFLATQRGIEVYDRGAIGAARPKRLISGISNKFSNGDLKRFGIGWDARLDRLYATGETPPDGTNHDFGDIEVFPAGADGPTRPLWSIPFSNFDSAVAVDCNRSQVYFGETAPRGIGVYDSETLHAQGGGWQAHLPLAMAFGP